MPARDLEYLGQGGQEKIESRAAQTRKHGGKGDWFKRFHEQHLGASFAVRSGAGPNRGVVRPFQLAPMADRSLSRCSTMASGRSWRCRRSHWRAN